jgi:beta-galactosidase
VRVDETDSLPPAQTNTVVLARPGEPEVRSEASFVFDLVIPQGAEPVGSYTQDFYAGTPAVTRNEIGDGSAWYVGACLDQRGVDWVIRHALAEQGLLGVFADVPDLEHTTRAIDGRRYEFVLNHSGAELEVDSPFSGTDILSGRVVNVGEPLRLAVNGVAVIEVG